MLITAKLDNNLWGEAVTAANYLRNSLPCAALDGKSRYEEIYNKETKISHRKVFGCVANPLKLNNKDDKFASISKKNCILIGYGEKERIYWILKIFTKKTITIKREEINLQFFTQLKINMGQLFSKKKY